MKGNFHVQFLGEGVAATSPPYPTPGWATTQVYPARITHGGSNCSVATIGHDNCTCHERGVSSNGTVMEHYP